MIPDPILQKIENLKNAWKYDEALKLVNRELAKDPSNKEALFQIADIEYRKGEISRAEKPIDFLLKDASDDAMSYYIKGVLEMEKTHRGDAKKYFQKTLELMDQDNPEVLRCYGLCEYWSGNREEGMILIKKAFDANKNDAEIILNLVELSILEEERTDTQEYIQHYHTNIKALQFFDRKQKYYDEKIAIFEEYVRNKE